MLSRFASYPTQSRLAWQAALPNGERTSPLLGSPSSQFALGPATLHDWLAASSHTTTNCFTADAATDKIKLRTNHSIDTWWQTMHFHLRFRSGAIHIGRNDIRPFAPDVIPQKDNRRNFPMRTNEVQDGHLHTRLIVWEWRFIWRFIWHNSTCVSGNLSGTCVSGNHYTKRWWERKRN